jgi:hypothetical protein
MKTEKEIPLEEMLLIFNKENDSVSIDFNCPFIGQCPDSFFYRLRKELKALGVELLGQTPLEKWLQEVQNE